MFTDYRQRIQMTTTDIRRRAIEEVMFGLVILLCGFVFAQDVARTAEVSNKTVVVVPVVVPEDFHVVMTRMQAEKAKIQVQHVLTP